MSNCENCKNFGVGGCHIAPTTGDVWTCNFDPKFDPYFTTASNGTKMLLDAFTGSRTVPNKEATE